MPRYFTLAEARARLPEVSGAIRNGVDAKKVLAADVFSTDPPLGKGSKYTVLKDPKHVTGFQNVAPIVKTSVATAAGSTFTKTVNAVSSKLTLS